MPVRLDLLIVAICFASVFAAGCGSDGPELATVTGRITLDGVPAPKLNITFTPESENGAPSYGGTDESGEYTLYFTTDKAGAMIGKHSVRIEPKAAEMDENGNVLPDQNIPDIPRRYALEGTLAAEVKAGSNSLNFALESTKDAVEGPPGKKKSTKRNQ